MKINTGFRLETGGWKWAQVPNDLLDDPEVREAGLRVYTALKSFRPGTDLTYAQVAVRAKSTDKDFRMVKRGFRELHKARWTRFEPQANSRPLVTVYEEKQPVDAWGVAKMAPRTMRPPSPSKMAPPSPSKMAPPSENAYITRAREVLDVQEGEASTRGTQPLGVKIENSHQGQLAIRLDKAGFLAEATRQAGDLLPGTLQAFLDDPYWRQKGHPVGAFRKQLPDYLAAAKRRSQKAAHLAAREISVPLDDPWPQVDPSHDYTGEFQKNLRERASWLTTQQ